MFGHDNSPKTIVFVPTKTVMNAMHIWMYDEMKKRNIPTKTLDKVFGGSLRDHKEKVLKEFNEGQLKIMIATKVWENGGCHISLS